MSNNKKTSNLHIAIKIFLASCLVMMNVTTTFAGAPVTIPEDTINPASPATSDANSTTAPTTESSVNLTGMSSFNVQKYLTVNETTQTSNAINVKVDNLGLQGGQDQTYLKSQNPVGAFILQIINMIALTSASLSFLAIVIAGFMMMASTGNENMLNRGRDVLGKAIGGLVITLSAYYIVSFVQNLLFETATK